MADLDRNCRSLELDKVLAMLSEITSCADSKKLAEEIAPTYDYYKTVALMDKTYAAYNLMMRHQSPTFYQLKNCNKALGQAKRGAHLSYRELLDIANILRNIRSLKQWRTNCESTETALDDLFGLLVTNRPLEDRIFNTIISEEEMADNASMELASIRKKITNTQLKVRNNLDKMIKSPSYQKFLQDPIVTIRDGRFVIPVKSEHRGDVKGLVHDTSSSGATFFIEPIAVVEANNEIKILKASEKQEMERIIAELSAEVGDYADAITDSYGYVIELDLYFSKAKLAYAMKANCPQITDNQKVNIIKGRHPLIDKNVVVPIDISLGYDFNTIVVTGPNTGGKTVALKTIGLLSLMVMCGLMVPAQPESSISVFDKILVDIGDEQSIEQSLSTFSSHMTNIVSIIKEATPKSLVLLDELGSGTDPVEGAALAISIIEEISSYGSKIAATTHYAELKVYALTTPNVCNASCEFNIETLKPTYKLLIGVPGKSNAFAISERLGLSTRIIENAKEHISSENTKFEDVVSMLEATRQELEKEKELAFLAKVENQKINKELKTKQERLQASMDKELERSRVQAKQIVEQARFQSSQLLNELEDIKKQKDNEDFGKLVGGAKGSYKKNMDKLDDLANPIIAKKKENYKLPRAIKKGDIVIDNLFEEKGTVLTDPDSAGNVMVQVGIMKRKVNQKELQLCDKPKQKLQTQQKGRVTKSVTRKSEREITRELDLRGLTVEEALMEVDLFIDNCVMTGVDKITIIHGKGTGALKNAVHQHLKSHRNIRTFRLGVYGEGEAGVTIADLV